MCLAAGAIAACFGAASSQRAALCCGLRANLRALCVTIASIALAESSGACTGAGAMRRAGLQGVTGGGAELELSSLGQGLPHEVDIEESDLDLLLPEHAAAAEGLGGAPAAPPAAAPQNSKLLVFTLVASLGGLLFGKLSLALLLVGCGLIACLASTPGTRRRPRRPSVPLPPAPGYDTGCISGALPYIRDDVLQQYAGDPSALAHWQAVRGWHCSRTCPTAAAPKTLLPHQPGVPPHPRTPHSTLSPHSIFRSSSCQRPSSPRAAAPSPAAGWQTGWAGGPRCLSPTHSSFWARWRWRRRGTNTG